MFYVQEHSESGLVQVRNTPLGLLLGMAQGNQPQLIYWKSAEGIDYNAVRESLCGARLVLAKIVRNSLLIGDPHEEIEGIFHVNIVERSITYKPNEPSLQHLDRMRYKGRNCFTAMPLDGILTLFERVGYSTNAPTTIFPFLRPSPTVVNHNN